MTDIRTLRIKNPGDLVASVPLLLGFHPEESAVLLTVGGATDPFFARVDLPSGPDDVEVVVEDLCEVAGRHGLRSVALVLFTDDATAARLVHDAFVDGLATRAVDVQLAVRADGTRWYPLSGLRGDPDEGEEYDLTTHPFTLQAMVEGRVIHASRTALGESLLPADPGEVERVGAAVEHAGDRLVAASRHPLGPPDSEGARRHLVAEGRWVQQRVRRLLADVGEGGLSDEDAGRLLVGLLSIEVRDVAWAEMTRDNARRHVDLWRDVVRRAPRDVLAPPATLLAFAAWLAGDGALAWCALDRAKEADPDYSMAMLVERALTCAVPPSTWEPLKEEHLTLFAA
jgi:hypothetical protein